MSYCRWSSDDYQCDIYAYESVHGGFEIHVARRRVVEGVPKLDWDKLETDVEEFARQHNAQLEWITAHGYVPINGPFDGESYHEMTLSDFRDRLILLRAVGYRFPDEVLAMIESEMMSMAAG